MTRPSEPRRAAFLRGINLGKRRVKMKRLRELFEDLGFENVGSHIASGNVVFDAAEGTDAELEHRIEDHLEAALGYEVDTHVRPLGRLAELLEIDAVDDAREEGFTPYVTFLEDEPDDGVRDALAGLETPDDRFLIDGREVFWFRRGRLSDSAIETRHLEAALGGGATRRKLDTVARVVEKFAPSGDGT